MNASSTITDSFESFPLKDGRRFVVWNYERRGGKPTKVLKIPTTRGIIGASHSDPNTWGTWEQALEAYATGMFTGIGRVFAEEDGLIGVDFDDVLDPNTGEFDAEADSWLRILDSYSEVSPSLTGVKVWVRGRLPRSYKKGGLEVYRSHRFFTITGRTLPQCSPEVNERQEALEALVDWYFPPREARKADAPRLDGDKLDLDAVLQTGNVEILSEMHDGTARVKYGIVCPWVGEHTGGDESGTRVGQYADGALFFHCEHSHCADRKWQEFREKVSPRVEGWSRNPKTYISGKTVSING